MKLKNLKNNKGFSLVELLVSFAIFGVLCTALVGFITMSSRSYRKTSDMINLQIEYQVVMTMLSEYVIDCNGSIEFNDNTLTVTNVGETPYVFSLDDDGLFLGTSSVSRNVTAFEVRLADTKLLGITMSFSPTNPHDDRTYTAEQLVALRNSPPVVINGTGGNDEDDDDE
ncbi:MAG: type II secretion system GspH family protein [Oscillospiraceae bacterium]|nr:type II secretion system GspH family protein [Oscillospiraceae bacterium]